MSFEICFLEAGSTQQLDFLASWTFAYVVVHLGKASTMTAAGAAVETMDFRRSCCSDGDPVF